MYRKIKKIDIWILASLLIILSPCSILVAQAGMDGSKHDFTFEGEIAPSGTCSACHNWWIETGWARNLSEEEAYFNQTEDPNYVHDPTIKCYDCHSGTAADNDPNYTLFINTTLGRYIPQDVAFDANMKGNDLSYDSSPSDDEIGYYESSTSGHYIKTNAAGLTNIEPGDKLPCTDCHDPHNTEPTNEVFIKGSYRYPLGRKVVSNLKASTNTRSGTGTGREICAVCHGYSDSGIAVRFVDVNPLYGSTDRIVQTPSTVSQHAENDSTPCTDCHSHSTPASYFVGISSHNTHLTAEFGPKISSCTGADGCHSEGNFSRFNDNLTLSATHACDNCHSPNGTYNGVTLAKASWEEGVYNGTGLKSGKEKWCASCHDEEPASSMGNGSGINAPNIVGMSLSGSWQSPVAIITNQTENVTDATNLLDGDVDTGASVSGASQIVFDLGESTEVSHIRLYTSASSTVKWEVYGSNDLSNWTRILYGQDVIWSAPAWLTGEDEGWDESRVDRIIPVRYIKLYKKSPWPVGSGSQREFEYKADIRYGYYTTGHKIACTNCHNRSSAHIDGTSQTYNTTLDNYQTGFRLKYLEVENETVPSLEIPRVDCNWGDYPKTSNDFALCFSCHNRYNLLGDASGTGDYHKDPPQTNFRNNTTNAHLIHLQGRGYCGNNPDWDSDWNGTADSPQSCTACHNVHGSPAPAMTRHGELVSINDTLEKAPLLNLKYINADGELDHNLSDATQSIGGRTQFYGAGSGNVAKNKVCNMCHNDQITYYRTPVPPTVTCGNGSGTGGCHSPTAYSSSTAGSHDTHLTAPRGPNITSCTGADGCHKGNHTGLFNDGLPLSTTHSCDNCHSPNGTYDGVNDTVIGAKPNWENGVYNNSTTLKSGKEKWCAGCHDDEPAYSKAEYSEVIVDNTEASFVGSWSTSSHSTDYGSNYRYNGAGSGTETATWTPNLPESGNYSVYAWWPIYTSGRATNAPYTVYYSGGSETIRVNQKVGGGRWNYLGTWNFSAGTSGYVVLSDDADGVVMADAIRFVKGGNATYAPNIIGDNTSYGFYATGHGRSGVVDCLSCHDSTKNHIDGIQRTYEADESTGDAITPYNNSYRLKDIDGLPAMVMPRKTTSTFNMQAYWRDFNLCFDCHNRFEVLGETSSDISNTNFWNNDSSISNSHWLHLGIDSKHFDSDYDSSADSRESCIACHNVHGSPTGPMIRHGELISYPGTANKEPAHNFYYLLPGDGSATARFTPTLAGGTYDIYAWWSSHSNRATNAKYIIYHDGGSAEVIVNQEKNGSQWNLLGEFNITTSNGTVILTSDGANEYIMADGIQWNRTDGGDTVYVDEPDATYTGTWTEGTSNPDKYYGNSTRYYYAPIRNATANVNKSTGGTFYVSGAITANHLCQMCHSNVQYNRDPYTGPRIPYSDATPDNISNFESNTVTFTAFVTDVDENIANVTIDLSSFGGNVSQRMYDDGTHGDTKANDGVYSYQFTVPAGVDDGPGSITLTATDDDGNSGEGLIDLTVYQPGALIIDDEDASFTGTWGESTADETTYGTGYRWHAAGTGSNTATWSINITTAGNYTVYARWVTGSNRATDAPYTINYEGGNETVRVSQRIKGGKWNRLGNYYFDVGEYSVVLTDDADNYVIADAIKFESQSPPAYHPWPIADNPDAEYNGTGWCAGTADSGYYGSDFYYHASGTGENTARWTLAVPEAGKYDVYAWWADGSNRATNAPYTINYEGGSETVRISQKVNGGKWNLLGTYSFNAGNYSVVLSDDADGFIIADAVKFEP
ncbi:Doubled CXXCH motif (Paired_CXXCH_1) [Candidatus Methanoperedenaceae archaeon GB50]|nr:Doubled CXXCH motif (Paired_CXXCH_1) [Candidatus Methanoperedenaceae archaeon GB50]CAD7779616.1 MAG: Doubled CXXCH motif (Paired_CXXCH_1) [Candidatus Methanoperedenaceae archaeon GB50]